MSAALRSVPNTMSIFQATGQSNLFLWTKAQLIVVPPIAGELGLSRVRKLPAAHFSVMVKGKWLYLLITSILIVV